MTVSTLVQAPADLEPGVSATLAQVCSAQRCHVRIRPSRGWRALDLRELWHYRELLWFLVLRDIKLRYKQTALGVAWVVLQPLLTMVIFTVFFGKLAKMPSDGLPY